MGSVSHRHFCGVDLHQTVAQMCIRDRRGEVVGEHRIGIRSARGRDELLGGVLSVPAVRIAVEALGLNRWFVNRLLDRDLALDRDVVVVHPAALKLKESGRKTDRRDARELSRRLWLGDLDRVARTYYPGDEEYDTRRLLRMRHRLVRMRGQLLSQIRASFRAYALSYPSGTLRSRVSLQWLEAHVDDLPAGAQSARACVATLRTVQGQLEVLELEIARRAQRNREVMELVQTIPQVAELTALTIVAELGDLSRFRSPREVASYAGLVPSVYDTGETQRHGRLRKKGNRELRWILGQVAIRQMATDPQVKRWAARRGHRMHKNRLRTALARRLLIGIYRSRCNGEPFSLQRCLGQ